MTSHAEMTLAFASPLSLLLVLFAFCLLSLPCCWVGFAFVLFCFFVCVHACGSWGEIQLGGSLQLGYLCPFVPLLLFYSPTAIESVLNNEGKKGKKPCHFCLASKQRCVLFAFCFFFFCQLASSGRFWQLRRSC